MCQSLSHIQLFVTPLAVACEAPLSAEFLRQECWTGLPFPSRGDLSDPGIESGSPALQADFLPSEPPGIKNKNESVLLKCPEQRLAHMRHQKKLAE